MGIDTREIVPDTSSENIITSEANTTGLAFITCSQLLSILCLNALNDYTISGGLLTSAIVFWGMLVDTSGSYEPFDQIFSLIKRYRIPFLITLGGHELSCLSFLEKVVPNTRVEKSYSISPFILLLSTQPESFILTGGTLNPDFIRGSIRNFKDGNNQLIICQNPIYVQKVFYELLQVLRKRKLPERSLQIYHCLFSIKDKADKKNKLMSGMRRRPVILVSSMAACSEILCQFHDIFILGLPYAYIVTRIIDSLQDIRDPYDRSRIKIVWQFEDPLQSFDSDTAGHTSESEVQRFENLMSSLQSDKYWNGDDDIDTYKYAVPAISGVDGDFDAETDRLYRFMFPIRSKIHLLNLQSRHDNRSKYLTLPHGSILHCSLPYNEHVGLIGSK
jgi:hypothetical protein